MWLTFRQVQPLYGSLLSAGPEFYFGLAGKKFQFGLSGTNILFRCYEAPAFEATIDSAALYSNLVLLSALLLATPGMRWKRRCLVLALGLTLLSLSHTAFVVSKVAAKHPLAGIESFWRFWDDFFEIMGKEFFPILIWLLLGLRYMLGASDKLPAQPGVLAVGRNAPCPCGRAANLKFAAAAAEAMASTDPDHSSITAETQRTQRLRRGNTAGAVPVLAGTSTE